ADSARALHDALPISTSSASPARIRAPGPPTFSMRLVYRTTQDVGAAPMASAGSRVPAGVSISLTQEKFEYRMPTPVCSQTGLSRSEEHTSELQSRET